MKIKKLVRFLLSLLPQSVVLLLMGKRLKKSAKNDMMYINNIVKQSELLRNNKKALVSFAYINRNRTAAYSDSYLKRLVNPVKIAETNTANNLPILVCAEKNDLKRIKPQIEYHRKIGIKHFAYIDNVSDDGTFEWLREQPDVSLFSISEKYDNVVKNAWIRQITDYFGYEKWYLIVDSDEFFIYPGIEKIKINQYIDYLEKRKIKSTFSPMIDMYAINSDENTGQSDDIPENFVENYRWFDTDSYKKENQLTRYRVTGGVRKRLKGMGNTVSKYSLIKLSQNMIIGTHENHPYKVNFETDGAIAFLLHYKVFLNDNTAYKGSQKLESSMDLLKINLTDRIFFSNFLKDKV